MKIDAHHHLWVFDTVRDAWIDDSMAVIQKDFLAPDFKEVLHHHQFDGCISVQAEQSEKENDFLLEQALGNDFIKGIVGWVDLRANNIEDRLAHYYQEPLIKGFRHILQGEKQRDLMLQPDFKNGISLLAKYNFTYDILIFPDQLQFAEQLVKAFPNQKFIIDHIAKPDIKNQHIKDWEKDIRAIANHDNVYCKVSGMVTEAHWQLWKEEDFKPYLDIVFEAFGIKRLLYGSDWPVCNVAGGYTKALNILKNYTDKLSTNEQALFFGENAVDFYNI
ncbi:amidohydrolase family protein [Pelobium sp.]|nr:amidohydrolase family protein [Pelobium sp.]MDA9554608.1 amidohydrolase family protein [Pelobium sp.]